MTTSRARGYTREQREEVRASHRAGESRRSIARALGKQPGSVHDIIRNAGGIAPRCRQRSALARGAYLRQIATMLAAAFRAAVLEADFTRERLVAPDERGGREAQEADGVGNRARLAGIDERLVEGDLPAAIADAGVDHPEGAPNPAFPLAARPRFPGHFSTMRSWRRILRTSPLSGANGKLAMLLGGESP